MGLLNSSVIAKPSLPVLVPMDGVGFKEETRDGLVAAATLWLSPNT